MAKEKGNVVLFGNSWSGRATVAKMLVCGELKDCSLEPTDSNSECQTYVGRGWTVIDSMGFGEPLGGTVPDEYVRKIVIDFLNEVQGRYSHIIFVVDRADFRLHTVGAEFLIPIMWRTFLEIFKGGEENFVVVVTDETPAYQAWTDEVNEIDAMMKESLPEAWLELENERDATIMKHFPECKHFLHTDFGNPDAEKFPNDGYAVPRIKTLEKFEKEMEEMFPAANCSWAEPEISKMGDAEIQEMAAKISSSLTSRPAVNPRKWGWRGSVSKEETFMEYQSIWTKPSAIEVLQGTAMQVLKVRDEMHNLSKEVKFFPRQCEYLLQRSMGASKELQDLVGGTVEAIWNDDDDDYHLAPLLKSLDRLDTCTEAARDLLQLCGNSKKEHEVALTLSSPSLPGTANSQVSKFAQVIRDLDWSVDAFLCLLHNPEAQRASSESERQSWLSKFMWCESKGRLVYVGDDEDKGVADVEGEGEDKNVVQSSTVAGDNDRQAQDQRDLVSAMESHFTTFRKSEKAVSTSSFLPLRLRKKIRTKNLSSSEIVSYMTILRNRLQGDASFDGDSNIRTIPGCFRIPGKQEYKAIQSIGEGSYKAVHKCDWLGMDVAIATESQRNGQFDQGGEDSRSILEAEAGLLARVQHPNVVTFIGYGYDEENRRGFQVSEIMVSSLRTLLDNSYRSKPFKVSTYPFSVSQLIDILLQIVEAMIHVHECGVIYRDLKADNCLIKRKYDGIGWLVAVVKLTDFGESELQSPEMGCHFNSPNKGSRRWMAPELYRWLGEEVKLYTWSADVYSFGMTCYEIVTGELPFGISNFSRRLGEAVRNGVRPTIPSNCPDELRELMTKCWAHSPEDRPSFKEIREILWRSRLYHTIWNTHSDAHGMFGYDAIRRRSMVCWHRR